MPQTIRFYYLDLCRRVPTTWRPPQQKTLSDFYQSIKKLFAPEDHPTLISRGIRYRERQAALSRRTFWYWFARTHINSAQIMEKRIGGTESMETLRRLNLKKRAVYREILHKKDTLNEIKRATEGVANPEQKPRYRRFIYRTNSISVEGIGLSSGPYIKPGAFESTRVHLWHKGHLYKIPNEHYTDWWEKISNGTALQRNNAESSWRGT